MHTPEGVPYTFPVARIVRRAEDAAASSNLQLADEKVDDALERIEAPG